MIVVVCDNWIEIEIEFDIHSLARWLAQAPLCVCGIGTNDHRVSTPQTTLTR